MFKQKKAPRLARSGAFSIYKTESWGLNKLAN